MKYGKKQIGLLLFLSAIGMSGCGQKAEIETAVQSLQETEEVVNGISIMEVCPEMICENRDSVNYGNVIYETYDSSTTGCERGVNILLPADYDESVQYPVLYVLHGIFGDEYTLIRDENNKIPEIVGNLVSDGTAKDMIVVFPNMFAATEEGQQPGFTAEGVAPYDNFINDLVNDLMPYMKEHYSILEGRENQAIAGFSMGGREALFIGFSRPDLFGYVGAISPAPGLTPAKDAAMQHEGQMQEEELTFADREYEPYVLMICCGTKDSVVGKFPESYHEIMEANGVSHIWYEVPGADHNSVAIRSGLNNFISLIFKN
jgi:enterochelin esterase-like enzyme